MNIKNYFKNTCSLLVTMLILASCSSTTPEDEISKRISTMTEMAELGTTEYTISKIVKAEDNAFYKIGERKILFTCKAYIKAGVDLKGFSQENVKYDKNTNSITVTLPAPKILSFNMPADKIKQEYVNVGFFRSDFSVEERNALLKQGEDSIKADIPNLGILDDARANATSFFKTLFSNTSAKEIKVEFNE